MISRNGSMDTVLKVQKPIINTTKTAFAVF